MEGCGDILIFPGAASAFTRYLYLVLLSLRLTIEDLYGFQQHKSLRFEIVSGSLIK